MTLIDFILHIDDHLVTIVNQFGGWSYLILFAIIFIETGVVIFPFLPGDSLSLPLVRWPLTQNMV